MKIYYAHPMSWYGSDRERMDVAAIDRGTPLQTEIINPNDEEYTEQVETLKQEGQQEHIMNIFLALVRQCDAIAYRTFDDDFIGAGVALEVLTAAIHGKQIFRIMDFPDRTGNSTPTLLPQQGLRAAFGPRVLTIVQTRDRIKRGVV